MSVLRRREVFDYTNPISAFSFSMILKYTLRVEILADFGYFVKLNTREIFLEVGYN